MARPLVETRRPTLERTRRCERQNKPPAAIFERVAHQHRRNCEQTKQRKWIHAASPPGFHAARFAEAAVSDEGGYGLRAVISHHSLLEGSFSMKRSCLLTISNPA